MQWSGPDLVDEIYGICIPNLQEPHIVLLWERLHNFETKERIRRK